MASNEQGSWRRKYLRALHDLERQELEMGRQIELLQGVVRVSHAAEGLDSELDQAMDRLREQLRQNKEPRLKQAITDAESAVLRYQRRRRGANE